MIIELLIFNIIPNCLRNTYFFIDRTILTACQLYIMDVGLDIPIFIKKALLVSFFYVCVYMSVCVFVVFKIQ